jgi:hypothetical protein
MTFLTSVRLLLGDTAAIFLAFALGVLFCPAITNLIAAVSGLTARLAARLAPAAAATSATAKPSTPPAPAAAAATPVQPATTTH